MAADNDWSQLWREQACTSLSEMHPKSILQIGYFYFPNRKTLGRNITISQIFKLEYTPVYVASPCQYVRNAFDLIGPTEYNVT